MRISLRGESTIASRAFANRCMKNLPTEWSRHHGSCGPRSTVNSISRAGRCVRNQGKSRSITCLRGSALG